MRFDFDRFIASYNGRNKALSSTRQHALWGLLTHLQTFTWPYLRMLAYVLATARHETAGTYAPIKEYRAREGSALRTRQDRYWLTGYYGRGYVQLTWKKNYVKAQLELRRRERLRPEEDLVANPDLALRTDISAAILALGMLEGWFTGRSLALYITEAKTDYLNARRVVNGIDQAERIAGYATDFELHLRYAGLSEEV